jgi:hypothetical protein
MANKKLRVNGFWLFAQVTKHLEEDKGYFSDWVEKIDEDWRSLSEEQKNNWKNMAKEFRETRLNTALVEMHTEMRQEDNGPWQEIYHLTYDIFLVFTIRWVMAYQL